MTTATHQVRCLKTGVIIRTFATWQAASVTAARYNAKAGQHGSHAVRYVPEAIPLQGLALSLTSVL